MTFIPKNWQDTPSTVTPISAAALEDLEARVTDYTDDIAGDTLVLAGDNLDAGTDLSGVRPQLRIAPTSDEAVFGGAEIILIPNDDTAPSGHLQFQHRTAIIRFHPERAYEADASIKCHRHTAGDPNGALNHFVIHTKNASDELTDHFSIEYLEDDPAVQISASHLQLHTDAYISGTAGDPTGAVLIKGAPDVQSGNAATNAQYQLGRTASEFRLAIAGSVGAFSSKVTAAGDVVLRHDTATQRIILQCGNDSAAIVISGASPTAPYIGFFDSSPVAQPTPVADATDAATAITQLNALLSRMRTLGLIDT